jgi:UDP-glucose 4-epimerase
VADQVIEAMNLVNVRKIYKPVLHGVGWPGDVKKIALKIDKVKGLGFRPIMNSRDAVRVTAKNLLKELLEE